MSSVSLSAVLLTVERAYVNQRGHVDNIKRLSRPRPEAEIRGQERYRDDLEQAFLFLSRLFAEPAKVRAILAQESADATR